MSTAAPPATSPARRARAATRSRQSAPATPLLQKGAAVATETAATNDPTRSPEAIRTAASLSRALAFPSRTAPLLSGVLRHAPHQYANGTLGSRTSTRTGSADFRKVSASSRPLVPST